MKLRLTRSLDDLPPQTSDAELLEWAAALGTETPPVPAPPPTSNVGRPAPVRPAPVVIMQHSNHLSDEELFADIFERAAAVGSAPTD